MYENFDSDLKIIAASGKYFSQDSLLSNSLNNEKVKSFSFSIETKAILKVDDRMTIVELQGVDENFQSVSEIKSTIKWGSYKTKDNGAKVEGVFGIGIASKMRIFDLLPESELRIFVLSKDWNSIQLSENLLKQTEVVPSGIFSIQKDYDESKLIVPLATTRSLINCHKCISTINIKLKAKQNSKLVRQELENSLGGKYLVLDRNMQHTTLFKLMTTEKYISFLLLTLILILVMLNVLGVLVIINNQKKTDFALLRAFGANSNQIKFIIISIGLLLGTAASAIGASLGLVIVELQVKYKLIKLSDAENLIIDYFPMQVDYFDILLTISTVVWLSLFASYYPSNLITRLNISTNLRQ
jgi:lipoprotein-releasing system permease protein